MAELKDKIDFSKGDIRGLFNKLFYPTLLGLVFSMVFNLTDGIFVGRGIGSMALAAVNIVAPLFTIVGAIGLMLGTGGSVVASIHLSQGKEQTARIVVTQSVVASVIVMILLAALMLIFPEPMLRLFGCSDTLMPYAKSYTLVIAPFFVMNAIILCAEFFVRLDGSPKYAMVGCIISSLLNIFLDWLFIFPFGWGLFGAALATGISMTVGAVMLLVYLFNGKRVLHFCRVKISTRRAWAHSFRNVGYMCKLGVSTFLAQMAVSFMMIIGNNVFVRLAGDTAVAAFSVVCYTMPIVFMVYDAIAMSAQPIVSYNYGIGDSVRVKQGLKVGLSTGLAFGSALVFLFAVFSKIVVGLFIGSSDPAYPMAIEGLRLFSIGFIPMAVNIIVLSYFQSIEKVKAAALISALRGFVILLIAFLTLPHLLDIHGAWLSVPVTEVLTCVVTLVLLRRNR